VLLWIGLVGCANGDPADDSGTSAGPRLEADLADMTAWTPGSEAVAPDPLLAHRPADASCPEGSVIVEGGSIEVNTGLCAYAWLQQPLLADLRPDDTVELVFWHSALVTEAPAEGHIALFVGNDLLYERVVSIPFPAMAYTETVAPDLSAPEGETLTLHLHNHGVNTWNLLRVERVGVP
jgi:hypothetical protein